MTVIYNIVNHPDGITHSVIFTTNIPKGVNSDSIDYTFPPNVTSIDVLVIGGGGAGGGIYYGAGGGAGGFIEQFNVPIEFGRKYTISVGTGGLKGDGGGVGTDGGNSSIIGPLVNIVAYGGGRGGSNSVAGNPGGCGGGGSGGKVGGTGWQGGDGGGSSSSSGTKGGGGGGAGGNGITGTSSYNAAYGGPGKVSSLSGVEVTYATGGRGGNYPGVDVIEDLGNGGESNTNSVAHDGGNGVVIVRYTSGFVAVCESAEVY